MDCFGDWGNVERKEVIGIKKLKRPYKKKKGDKKKEEIDHHDDEDGEDKREEVKLKGGGINMKEGFKKPNQSKEVPRETYCSTVENFTKYRKTKFKRQRERQEQQLQEECSSSCSLRADVYCPRTNCTPQPTSILGAGYHKSQEGRKGRPSLNFLGKPKREIGKGKRCGSGVVKVDGIGGIFEMYVVVRRGRWEN